jgi:signal transduction histidine kinase
MLQKLLDENIKLKELSEKLEMDLILSNREHEYQNSEKEKRANELVLVIEELSLRNHEKKIRASELVIANKELAFQNAQKEKREEELIIANKELDFQNKEKEKRASELLIKNNELQQLLQLNADKDKFISIIAHDLRNPLNSIVGLSKLLIVHSKNKDFKKIDEFSNVIQKSSERAMNLLMNLITWAQSQSGSITVNPKYFNISALVDDISLLYNDIAKQKNILISSSLPENIQVHADKEMVATVFRNLISNALKFTLPEGRITISAIEKQNEIILSVSDSGIGLTKIRVDKLFQINEVTSTLGSGNEKGTGLGLILCKEFIEMNNGIIWVESEIGVGSTFFFSLPIKAAN